MSTCKHGRILGSDAARAVGLFAGSGPIGYRAKSKAWPAPLRDTRAEAEADECAHLCEGRDAS